MNCYLLTGGRSSRMGRAKGELRLGGRSFLERTVTAAAPVFEEIYSVTRSDSAPLPGLPAVFEEPHEDRSPLFGVDAALRHASGGRIWVLAVDYPLLTGEVLRHLVSRFRTSEAHLLVPVWSGRKQMLCAGYDARLAGAIRERLARHQYRLRDLTEECVTEYVEEGELRSAFAGEPLWNINRAEDYEALKEMYEKAATGPDAPR